MKGRTKVSFSREFLSTAARLNVRVETPDPDTVVLRNVPTNTRYYNKAATNVLVKRPATGSPLLLFVDDDLEYLGADPAITGRFASGCTQAGWRNIALGNVSNSPQELVEEAMATLGSRGEDPAPPSPTCVNDATSEAGILASYGISLTASEDADRPSPAIGRAEEVDRVAASVLRSGQMSLAAIVGEPGVGKSNLLRGVAHRILGRRPEMELIAVDMGSLFAGTIFPAERENSLATLLREVTASPNTILAAEHIELAITQTVFGALMLANAMDSGAKIIGTTLPRFAASLSASSVLARRVTLVELNEIEEPEAVEILAAAKEVIQDSYSLDIDLTSLRACVQAAKALPGVLPAKAIDLLHRAAARASLNKADVLGLDDVYAAAE